MNEDKKNINTNTLALMQLTEKLTENNNTVSGTMRLMSENIEEISEVMLRSEEKIDDCKVIINKHYKDWSDPEILECINKLNKSGFINFVIHIKKLWKVIVIAIVGTVAAASFKWVYEVWSAFQALSKVSGG